MSGEKNDLTSGTERRKFDKSERQIRYYIRLTNLIDGLLYKVNEGTISIKIGAELSYLNVPAQAMVNDFMEKELCTVSENQAKQIKNLYMIEQLLMKYNIYDEYILYINKKLLY